MNLLDMTRMGLLLTRASQERPSEPIATTTGLTGVAYEMCQWIIQSDLDIQLSKNGWLYMRGSADLLLPEGATSLLPSASLATVRAVIPAEDNSGRASIGCYRDTVDDESRVSFFPYGIWYGNNMGRGQSLSFGRPSRCSINRDGRILFDTTTDSNYHVTFDFMRQPQKMALSDDQASIIPPEHHMSIVWWAIARYYCTTRDKTDELKRNSGLELVREITRLHSAQLPQYTIG